MTARMSDNNTREDLNKVFRLFDADNTGAINYINLIHIAKELGETISQDELKDMCEKASTREDNAVSLDDFYNIINKNTFA